MRRASGRRAVSRVARAGQI